MAFCNKCGAKLEDGQLFCPSCGVKLEEGAATAENNAETNQQKVSLEGADVTAEFDKDDIEKNKIFAVLAYLSWLVLVPIFAAKDSKFARFHVNQGLVLAIAEIAWGIFTGILSAILPWQLDWIATILGLVQIAFAVFSILGIVNAATGKAKELPIIGKFKLFK